MIRLYGEFLGDSSLCRVSKGFAQVFPEAAKYDLTRWGNDLDEGEPEQPGATAEIGIYTGSLSHIEVAFRAKHEKFYVMVAPNSGTLGSLVRGKLATVENLLAPSRWAQEVLTRAFPDKEVLHVPHGLDPLFQPAAGVPDPEKFSVLHLSSSILERKGTDKLLEGWELANLPDAMLFLSVPLGKTLFFLEEAERLGIRDSVRITDRLDYGVADMAKLYSTMHFVCQPSRGEGFGLVPLEARACGTPVIATDCTGHSEHVRGPGVVVVKTGEDAPIDDFPGAVAPSLSAEGVAEALTNAYQKRDKYSSDAKVASAEIRKTWSWENQLKEFRNDVV